MDSSGSVLARRRRSRRHAGLVARSAGGSGARGRDVRRSSSKPGSLVIVAAAAAATIVACSSAVQARDSATVSAGYQHTCLITADADVKVSRGSSQTLSVSLCFFLCFWFLSLLRTRSPHPVQQTVRVEISASSRTQKLYAESPLSPHLYLLPPRKLVDSDQTRKYRM